MTRYAFVLFTVAIVLSGCASAPREDPRDAAMAQHLGWVQEQIAAKKMTKRDGALSAQAKTRELGIADPYTDEVWAYRVMLGGQVDRGEINDDQAAYLDQQKVNQVLERAQAAAQRQAAQPSMYPRAVTCRPDGWGGVRCR